MALFRSKHADNADTVRARRAAATDRLAELEAERGERALEAALSDDPATALGDINQRILVQRELIAGLEAALGEAERLEKKRLADAADAAEKARQRAVTVHGQQLVKAGAAFTTAMAEAVARYHDLIKGSDKLRVLLKEDEFREFLGYGQLRTAIVRLVDLEVSRVGYRDQQYRPGTRTWVDAQGKTHSEPTPDPHPDDLLPSLPCAKHPLALSLPHGVALADVPRLEDALQQKFGTLGDLIAGLRRPAAPRPAEPVPEPQRPPDAPAEGGGGRRPDNATIRGGPELIGDWRGHDLGLPPADELTRQPEPEPAPVAQSPTADIAEAHRVIADPSSSPEAVAAAQELLSWRVPQR